MLINNSMISVNKASAQPMFHSTSVISYVFLELSNAATDMLTFSLNKFN